MRIVKNMLRKFVLVLIGKDPNPPKRDILDVMFENPHLTMKQAYWQVNSKRIVWMWVARLATMMIIALLIWRWFN